MYNPNDITINPNQTDSPANQPQPKKNTSSPNQTTISEEHFDIEDALSSLEEPTPIPEPIIKINPRNANAVQANHQEDLRNGIATPANTQIPTTPISLQTPSPTPTPPQTPTIPEIPRTPVVQPIPTQTINTPPQTPTIPEIPRTPDSPAKQAVHQAFGIAGVATATTATSQPQTPHRPNTPTTPQKIPPRTINTKKKGKRISFLGFAIGCGLFLLLLLGGGTLVLWGMFQDPNQTRSIIDRASGELLIKLFAGTIFGVLTIFGVFFMFINIFRLASKKNTKKLSYIGGMFIGFIMLGAGLGAGIPAISYLDSLSTDNASTGIMVEAYVLLGNNEAPRHINADTPPLRIAPAKILFELNSTVYRATIGQLGLQTTPRMTLNCGNGQTFSYNSDSNTFGPCFYTEKGNYPISVTFSYTERSTGQTTEQVFDMGAFPIDGEISLTTTDGTTQAPLTLNSDQTELIAGIAPAKIRFDAQALISDLQLPTNDITWDIDNDDIFERTEDVVFSENFILSKLHTINYTIGTSPYTYTFDLRVQQSDVPICMVDVESTTSKSYDFIVSFVETNAEISQYGFEIINTTTNQIEDKRQSAIGSLSYDFTREGTYAVKAYFITDDGNRGECESGDFRVGAVPYVIDYETMVQGPNESAASVLTDSDILTINEDNIWTISSIPTKITIDIADIRPRSDTIIPIIELNGEPILSTNNKNFSINITERGEQTLTIGVRDTLTNEITTIERQTISINLPSIEGQLQVRPDNVGDEPFTVTLDASTVTLNDPDDEVVYFSWDFGDGEVKKNQNQGSIQHTYYFDKEKQEGIYYPTATITTRKGETMTLSLENPITVRRALRRADIIFDSHPAQLANIGENILISLTLDGIPNTVIWDFGDGNNFQCTGRTCNEITHNFLEAGTYTVSVTVSYNDHPDVTAKANIIIQ